MWNRRHRHPNGARSVSVYSYALSIVRYELLFDLLSGNEIHAQDNRCGNIIDVHSSLPKPSRPVAIFGVHVAIPIGNKASWTQSNHVHMAVISVILGDPFGEYLAAAVPCIRPINTGRRNEDDLVDVGGSRRLENLEGAADIEVEEIEGVFLAAIFVDA